MQEAYNSKRCGRRIALPLVLVETITFCFLADTTSPIGKTAASLRFLAILGIGNSLCALQGACAICAAADLSSCKACFSAAFWSFSSASACHFSSNLIARCAFSVCFWSFFSNAEAFLAAFSSSINCFSASFVALRSLAACISSGPQN